MGDEFVVWADGGLGERASGVAHVRLTRRELERSLADAEAALVAFAHRIIVVLDEHRISEARQIGDAFRETFAPRAER